MLGNSGSKTLDGKHRLVFEGEDLKKYFNEEQLREIAKKHGNYEEQVDLIEQFLQQNDHEDLLPLFSEQYSKSDFSPEVEVWLNSLLDDYPDISEDLAREGFGLEAITTGQLRDIVQAGGTGVPKEKYTDKEIKDMQTKYLEGDVIKERNIKVIVSKRRRGEEIETVSMVKWSEPELEFIQSRVEDGEKPKDIFLEFRKWSFNKGYYPRTKMSVIGKEYKIRRDLVKSGTIPRADYRLKPSSKYKKGVEF